MLLRRPLLALFALAATLLVAACGTYLDARAEAALREALARVVGPAASYDVKVSGAGAGGDRFERVGFVGRRIARANAPLIDRLALELERVVVDREAKRLVSVGAARAELNLLGTDLADFLRGSEWIADPVVTFAAPDRIVIAGVPRLAGISLGPGAGAEFEGRLYGSGSQLRLSVERVRIANTNAPGIVRAVIERAVNPVADLAAYPLPAQIDSVEARDGVLRVVGSGSRLPPSPP